MMKLIFGIIIFFILCAESGTLFGQKSRIYELEKRLLNGDKEALFKVAPYFDGRKKVIEFLGYHRIETTEDRIAKRIVEENCIFTKSEIGNVWKMTARQLLAFLKVNSDKIRFSTLANAFYITPLDARKANVEFRKLTDVRRAELLRKYPELLAKNWVSQAKIDSLISKKNSIALLEIASEFYKNRNRFDIYHFDKDECIDLLQLLTCVDIAVEDESNKLNWHIAQSFYAEPALNLLIYFAGNYSRFHWDEVCHCFKNNDIAAKELEKEDYLFELLGSENDSIATDAFTQLTICNPEKVIQLADEYQKANIEKNNSIPIFPYRFLKQLVVLTDYCRNANIDFTGSSQLRSNISKLQSELPFADRRKLENKMINELTLDEITAFEYYAMISEDSWELTYSAGRILDVFYSKNWKRLLNNEKQLKLYLKKSYLYDNLGIIGICNGFLKKFTSNGPEMSARLDSIYTTDTNINAQAKLAKSLCLMSIKSPNDTMKVSDGNRDFNLTNVEARIREVKYNGKGFEKMQEELVELLSQINYSQIGVALREIEGIVFVSDDWKKYTFMERDWGFLIEESFDSLLTRKRFLEMYDSLSEYDLYAYYLNKAQIDYKGSDGLLDYDKIYELLKYDVAFAFAGGGGGKKDNEVYSLIKLLELTHHTTLGYPKKLCNSNGIYGCDSYDRANEWRQYLTDNRMLKEEHNEPVSFNYR